MFIAAISSSGATDDLAARQRALPAQLKKKNHDMDFSAALIAAASTIGVVIPPSRADDPLPVIAGISGGEALHGRLYSGAPHGRED